MRGSPIKLLLPTLAIAVSGLLWLPAAAQADFGLTDFDVSITNADGTPATQAGSHPFALTVGFEGNYDEEETGNEAGKAFTEGRLRDVILEIIPGLVGDTTAYPRCPTIAFTVVDSGLTRCPVESAVGVTANSLGPGGWFGSPVFNLTPPPGVLLRLGFRVVAENVVVDVGVKPKVPYSPSVASRNIAELLYVFGNKTQLWGNPSESAHDSLRGNCYAQNIEKLLPGEEFAFESETGEVCPVAPRTKPFLTLPTRCSGQNRVAYAADSWEAPGALLSGGEPDLSDPNWDRGSVEPHDSEGNPLPFSGCGSLGFNPSITARPTTRAAQSPTGLDFTLDVKDEGLVSVDGFAQSQIKKAVVTLPEGMSVNPSQAEGLEVCSEAHLERETVGAAPGEGCPEASKIGTVEVQSPLVEEAIKGALYVAKPYENLADDSLIAVYMVIKNPKLGVIIKQPLKVEPDPRTGRLVTTADDIPQLPFSSFKLHFREGGRSPLISPPSCDSNPSTAQRDPYEVSAEMTPWSGSAPVTTTSTFTIISGPDESDCPPGGVAPFAPGFEAGAINNQAGSFSPFYMRLTRKDGEQDMTKFSSILPPGVLGMLAGIPKCPDGAIAAAKARTGAHGGQEELEQPSCPAASKIGRTLAGAGVGSQLTYVPGSLYLAGPAGTDPLSVVAITPAVAGPFDAGTVVLREALTANPVTAEAEVDGSKSDPIPHILKGIPLNVRDLRVYVDRPHFIFNATNCGPLRTRATLFGSFLEPLDPADDQPVDLQARYQAANCAILGFKPRLSLKSGGGIRRGDHPALRAIYRPRSGDANLKDLVVRLPRSAFLDQAHIRTVCTRVQFAADACPKGAEYGRIKAWTPVLDEPLAGPVYLRSSNHKLPDLVFDLHGLVDVEVTARIDSIRGGIRATIDSAPDAPLNKVELRMQGGRKGLIVNSRNLCAAKNRANVELTGQNLKELALRPLLKPSCGGGRKRG